MKPVQFHWAAKAELTAAMSWYEHRVKGLGVDLQKEVETATRWFAENPQLCSLYKESGFRKMNVRRFPFVIYFLELPDSIWVAAIAHGARRPDYWKGRQPEQPGQ